MEANLRPLWAIGLESDTAISGVDVALIRTDGVDIFERKAEFSRPYSPTMREAITAVLGEKGQQDLNYLRQVEEQVTQHHIEAVQELLDTQDLSPRQIDVIGFSGHTVLNRPAQKLSVQIGDAQMMLDAFGIPVVNRFYQTDLASGGQGSPIFPAYYEALARTLEKPLVIFSIGGISSLTYIGVNGELIAFDVGPGNVLIDRWMQQRLGAEMDFDGLWAAKGQIDERLLTKLMQHPAIIQNPPKALEREDFLSLLTDVEGSSLADGAATLTALTSESLVQACEKFLPEKPSQYIVTGGGAYNPSMVKYLRQHLSAPVKTADEIGWNTMCLDAESFAFLAVRCLFGLPLTYPTTTGVEFPLSGGKIWKK